MLSTPLLIYDDRCAFCRRWVQWLKRWDRDDRVALLSLHDAEAPRLAGRPVTVLRQAAHVVMPEGPVLAGAAALRALCRVLPGGAVPGALFAIPGIMWIAERLYQFIARRWGPAG